METLGGPPPGGGMFGQTAGMPQAPQGGAFGQMPQQPMPGQFAQQPPNPVMYPNQGAFNPFASAFRQNTAVPSPFMAALMSMLQPSQGAPQQPYTQASIAGMQGASNAATGTAAPTPQYTVPANVQTVLGTPGATAPVVAPEVAPVMPLGPSGAQFDPFMRGGMEMGGGQAGNAEAGNAETSSAGLL